MTPRGLPYTLSLWLTVTGAALSRTRPRAAGLCLLTAGLGGIGVAWERHATCDLRRAWRRPTRVVTLGTVLHVPLAVAGWRLLSRP